MFYGWSQLMPFKVVELDPVTFKEISEPQILFWGDYKNHGFENRRNEDVIFSIFNGRRPYYEEEYPWIEGPWVTKHNGKYYLTYSANSYESQDYGVGYATADSLTGEWKKYAGNPILHRYKELVGVGHHTMFRDKRGKLRIAFHAHQSVERIHPRTMYIGTMEFTPQGVMQMTDKGFIRPKSNRPDIVQ
jgi:hypothetical protein